MLVIFYVCKCELESALSKQQGYRFIGKMLLAAWSSLCGKWRLCSCTNIIIKEANRQASLKVVLGHGYSGHFDSHMQDQILVPFDCFGTNDTDYKCNKIKAQ